MKTDLHNEKEPKLMVPSMDQADAYLDEAEQMNPGPWVQHCRNAGQAAYRFAGRIKGLDPQTAYALGCLHDIGRRAGKFDLLHILHGYHFMMDQGYPDVARICLTHSYLNQDVHRAENNWDGNPEQLDWVAETLSGYVYNDYDRLIQLCDAVSIDSGYWLIEKRLLDVGIRRGVTEYSPQRWQKVLEIQAYFEDKLGCSIYSLLPGVMENTFYSNGKLNDCKDSNNSY
jgi:hypothetical protein